MKKTLSIILGITASFCLGFFVKTIMINQPKDIANQQQTKKININKGDNMELGAFSISLNVKDIRISKEFYEKLGFKTFGGSLESNYLIMKNGNSLIGIFQGMFDKNILTFNPGWDENAKNTDPFDDVRVIQKNLLDNGIVLTSQADEITKGPAYITLTDPDGNNILIEQHR